MSETIKQRAIQVVDDLFHDWHRDRRPLPDDFAEVMVAELNERGLLAQDSCELCGHEWRHHDPADGKCDSHAAVGWGVCPCGRDVEWWQDRNIVRRKLSRA